MKKGNRSFKIASWTLLIGGLGHTIMDLTTPKTPEQIEFIERMKEFTGKVLGTEFNMFSFFQGFSLMMGLLLFGYGALNLLILKNSYDRSLPSNVLILNVLVTFICVVLSMIYFFIIPTILTSIAFLGFFISFVLKIKEA